MDGTGRYRLIQMSRSLPPFLSCAARQPDWSPLEPNPSRGSRRRRAPVPARRRSLSYGTVAVRYSYTFLCLGNSLSCHALTRKILAIHSGTSKPSSVLALTILISAKSLSPRNSVRVLADIPVRAFPPKNKNK